MDDAPAPRSYHKVIIVALVLTNLLAIGYALYSGEPGQRDYYFREGTFYTWFYAAQMFAASLLFVACYFAHNIIPMENVRRRDTLGWLVFAGGFFLLAVDQVFRVREQLTLALAGTEPHGVVPAGPYALLKVVAVVVAVALVLYFRAIVLANVRMVLTFVAGFWFLLLMLVFDMLFDSIGITRQSVVIMEGSVKLLAMAMFVSAPFMALLERLHEARLAANVGAQVERRRHAFKDLRAEEPAGETPAAETSTGEEPVQAKQADEKPTEPAEDEEPVRAKQADEKPAGAKPADNAADERPLDASEKPGDEGAGADEKPADEAEKP